MKKNWILLFRKGISGWVLVAGRPKHGRAVPVGELPQYIRDFAMADQRGIIRDGDAQAVLDKHPSRTRQGEIRSVFEIDQPRHSRAEVVSPEARDAIKELDAYGHMNYCVGSGGEGDERGDWLACFDFNVFQHKGKKMVAYHTVVNSESGGFIDTPETNVVPASEAPFNLPDYWAGIGQGHGDWTEEEYEDASRTNTQWNEDLKRALKIYTYRPGPPGKLAPLREP